METVILQLIKIITTLFYNSLSKEKNNILNDEIRLVLNSIKINQKQLIEIPGNDNNIVENLRQTAEWMISQSDIQFSKVNIMQRIKINLNGFNEYIKIIDDALEEDLIDEKIKLRINELLSELGYEKKRNDIKNLISKAYADINFNNEKPEIGNFIDQLHSDVEKLKVGGKGNIKGRTGKIVFSDIEQIKNALEKGKNSYSNSGLIRTGMQGLDRACGGGIPRGYLVDVGALTFQYKTGMLRDIPLFMPGYNTEPWMWDKEKKPLIVRISFETTEAQDITTLAVRLLESTSGEIFNADSLNIENASLLLHDHYKNSNYDFILECFDPIYFSIYDLFRLFDEYAKDGYEVHLASIDYLALIAHNTIGDTLEAKMQRTYEMARNYFYPKGTTCFTGSQLNSEAAALVLDKNPKLVEIFGTGNYYKNCKSLRDKFDIELLTHIYKHPMNCKSYLTMFKGKHRGNDILKIPDSYNYWMYEFQEVGGIRYDGNDEPRFLTKIPDLVMMNDEVGWG